MSCQLSGIAPLVVAYALAGSMNVDLTTDPIGYDRAGKAVYSATSGRPPPMLRFVRNTDRKAFRPATGRVQG
jgi:aconitase A